MIDEFLRLYEHSVPVQKVDGSSEEVWAYGAKLGNTVRLADTKRSLDVLPLQEWLYSFFQVAPKFWMVPCETPAGKIFGFVFRSLEGKEYRLVSSPNSPQMLFGFGAFGTFAGHKSGYSRGIPVILTEGAKDCIFIQQAYRYTLALLSTSFSREVRQVICAMTDKVILALDNDPGGARRTEEIRAQLSSEGIRTATLTPQYKDWGQYFTRTFDKKAFNDNLRFVLGKL